MNIEHLQRLIETSSIGSTAGGAITSTGSRDRSALQTFSDGMLSESGTPALRAALQRCVQMMSVL